MFDGIYSVGLLYEFFLLATLRHGKVGHKFDKQMNKKKVEIPLNHNEIQVI